MSCLWAVGEVVGWVSEALPIQARRRVGLLFSSAAGGEAEVRLAARARGGGGPSGGGVHGELLGGQGARLTTAQALAVCSAGETVLSQVAVRANLQVA